MEASFEFSVEIVGSDYLLAFLFMEIVPIMKCAFVVTC